MHVIFASNPSRIDAFPMTPVGFTTAILGPGLDASPCTLWTMRMIHSHICLPHLPGARLGLFKTGQCSGWRTGPAPPLDLPQFTIPPWVRADVEERSESSRDACPAWVAWPSCLCPSWGCSSSFALWSV